MKILIAGRGFDTPAGPGLGVFELDQALALRAAGHEVRFAAVDTRSLRRRRPLGGRRYTLKGIPVYYAALPGTPRPEALSAWFQRQAGGEIWEILEDDGWRPQVIHAHFGPGLLAQGRKHGVPTVYTEHFSGANRDSVDRGELYRERTTYALADRLLCVSSSLAARLRAHTGAEARVVYNIVDMTAFAFSGAAPGDVGEFRLVSAGNLIPAKGFDLLLKALAEVRERGKDVSLTVFGGGPEETELRALADRLGLGRAVRFAGQRPRGELADAYRTADAFALASWGETFGVAYIEAMASGLPVIATACGGPEDYVNSSNGILTPVGDVPALAGAIERMMDRRGDYDRGAIAAFARENFSPERIAGELTAVYEELAGC